MRGDGLEGVNGEMVQENVNGTGQRATRREYK